VSEFGRLNSVKISNIESDLERRPKLVLEARPGEGRERGRPRLEWEEYVEGLARKRGRNLPEVKQLALDRKEYRKWLLLESDA
jgi:hypothetical protein